MATLTVDNISATAVDALSAARTSAEMAAVSADSATYHVARRVIFAGSVEDV